MPSGVDYNQSIEVANRYTMEKLTRHFAKNYAYPLSSGQVGRIDRREGKGTIDAYASSLGVPSNVNEHFLKFVGESDSYSKTSMKANVDYLVIWIISVLKRLKEVNPKM